MRVPVLENVVQIAIAQSHACAIASTDRAVYCWGAKGVTGSDLQTSTPTVVAGLNQVAQLALGDQHSCALLADATVRCWGYDGRTPTEVVGLRDVLEIASGRSHICARLRDGSVHCWGDNRWGQLGDANRKSSATPTRVPNVSARRITAGGDATCVVDAKGNALCWGANEGMLAAQASTARLSPSVIPGLSKLQQLALASSHVCGIDSDHRLLCVGTNCSGQAAHAQNCPAREEDKIAEREADSSEPFLDSMDRSAAVAVTSWLSCALGLDGIVKCWGDASHGKLGDGLGPAGLSTDPSYMCFGSDDACLRGVPAPVRFE